MKTFTKIPAVLCLALSAVFLTAWLMPAPADAAYVIEQKLGNYDAKVKLYGFSQLEGRFGEGFSIRSDKSDDGLRFTAQRIRLGTNYYYGNMFGKLFLDFNQPHDKKGGGLPEMIKDAFIGYRFNNAAFVRLGMIKTPVGMMFTTPGWNLDIVERNKLDKGLVLERDMGVLLSGRYIGFGGENEKTDGTEMGHEHVGYGFGYDIGVFNPAGRSAAVKRQEELKTSKTTYSIEDGEIISTTEKIDNTVTGDALAYAARIHFDYGEPLHFEAGYGVSEEAGGRGTEDYSVFSTGIDSLITPQWNVKLDYTRGWNILGVKDDDQTTVTAMVGYMINPKFEVVAKHYQSHADPAAGEKSDLGNTYVGLNFFLTDLGKPMADFSRGDRRKLQNNRIQVNYIFASGDTDDWTGHWGYTDDAVAVQWQYKF